MHIETALCKVNKRTSIIKKLGYTLPRKSSLTIFKALLRPHDGYSAIIYGHPSNKFFSLLSSMPHLRIGSALIQV